MLGTTFVITPDVVQSYIKAADTNNDGKISLEEFENMTIRGLKLAGIEIYK